MPRRSDRLVDVVLVRLPVRHHELPAHQPRHISWRASSPQWFARLHASIATVQPLGRNASYDWSLCPPQWLIGTIQTPFARDPCEPISHPHQTLRREG